MKFQGSELEDNYNDYWTETIIPMRQGITNFTSLVLSNIYYDQEVYDTINKLLGNYSKAINRLVKDIDTNTGNFSDHEYIKQYLANIIRHGCLDLNQCADKLSCSTNNTKMLTHGFGRFFALINGIQSKPELESPYKARLLDLTDLDNPFAPFSNYITDFDL